MRHEAAVTLAAEGYALATGRPGVCAVTAGPGFTNCLTGFADAAVWNVPLVLIAGRTALKRRGRGAVQDVDQEGMLAPLAKWRGVAYNAQSLQRLTDEAFHMAVSGRPGAVYLEVPHDVFMTRMEAPAGVWGFPAVANPLRGLTSRPGAGRRRAQGRDAAHRAGRGRRLLVRSR